AYGPREIVDAFAACLDAGLDFFDTAESYGWGKSEKILGALVRKSRRPLVVTTKYAPLAGRGGPSAIPKALDSSLKRLGLSQLDLYQLHWPDNEEVPIAATMEVLAETVHAGKARAVGVSNFSVAEMREAHAVLARHGVPLATNQVHYSLLYRAPEADGVADACRELGVTLLAYSPLEQGLLTGKYGVGALPTDGRAESDGFSRDNVAAAQPVVAQLRAIAAEHTVEPATVAIAWLLSKPGVVPLVGAKSGEQASRNARALALELSSTELDELDHLSEPWRRGS
ncbi:MAG TPA: aldo/keto reductase, partial [Candidatus Acidoferrales bacterium]|nr:aldo/keto reductase [Candidatus Acidoferrales bacterium]